MPLNNEEYFSKRYELIEVIGEGGESRVWKAYDHAIERVVAIKELKKTSRSHKAPLKEARAVARLNHPNIITLHDVIEQEKEVYLIFEYAEGVTLREVISQIGALSVDSSIAIFIQAAKGIEYAHNHGVLHLDIKPENILIMPDGKVKIADFGIARFIFEESEEGFIAGTIPYIAPEVLNGRYSERADIFSLGVIFYETLTGENPFYAPTTRTSILKIKEHRPEPPSTYNSFIPVELDKAILKALEKSPPLRYENVTRFRIKVERFYEGESYEEAVAELFEKAHEPVAVTKRLRIPLQTLEKLLPPLSIGVFFLVCAISQSIGSFQGISLATLAIFSSIIAFFKIIPGFLISMVSLSLITFLYDFRAGLTAFIISALIFLFLKYVSEKGVIGLLIAPASIIGVEPLIAVLISYRLRLRELFSFVFVSAIGFLFYLLVRNPESAFQQSLGSVMFLREITLYFSEGNLGSGAFLSPFLLEAFVIAFLSFSSYFLYRTFQKKTFVGLAILVFTAFLLSVVSESHALEKESVDLILKKMAISIFAMVLFLILKWFLSHEVREEQT